ncbi:MAG TPA: O-antigen ligase family protein [Gaiellaceae bacterium]|nr:O-antigen ligase family protein [Gaiellaceae bacterium]
MTERLPKWALYALVVALPAHNLAMALLWDLGVRDIALDAVSAWKEVLLALALGAIVWRARGVPFKSTSTDWLALAYTAFVLLYAVIPQDWLGGDATARGVLYGLRHDLTPVAAYVLGRGITLGQEDRRRLGWALLGAAGVVAAWGLVDIYAVSLQTWRDSGVPGWFGEQLGLDYSRGLSGLPENWVYNLGDERPLRRLVSTFLSPLASAYMLMVAILLAATWQRSRLTSALTALLAIGLLFTHSRTAIAALVVGLVALAYALRNWWPIAAAAVFLAAAFFFIRAYPDIAPETRYTPSELKIQREGGEREPTRGSSLDPGEASFDSHLDNLREGIDTVVSHPQGFGLGNAGVTAKRTDTEIKAGESTYTELGVETGLLGMLAFIAWSIGLLRVVLRRAPWLGASLAAVLVLGIQTDVIGVHWLAFVLWTLAGERA